MNAPYSEDFKMVCYDLLARLVPPQSCLKVPKNLPFSAKMTENKPFLMKKANSSELCDDFEEELDGHKDHNRPFKKLQNVGRSSKKVSTFYELYFLYFFTIENKLTT